MSTAVRVGIVVLALFTSTHADFTSDANTTSLIGHGATELGAGRKPRELFGAVDSEWLRLDFQAMGDLCLSLGSGGCGCFVQLISILGVLQFLIQAETQSVLSFVTNREIREDEVASLVGTIQINHTSHGSTGQYSQTSWVVVRDTALGDRAGLFQSREEEIVGVHGKGDVIIFVLLAIKDTELDDRGRVDRTTVGRRLGTRTTRASTLWLLQNLELVEQVPSITRGTREGGISLVGDWNDSGFHNGGGDSLEARDPDA